MSNIAFGVRRALVEGLVEKGVHPNEAKSWAAANLEAGVAHAQSLLKGQRRPAVVYRQLKDWAKSK